MSASKKRKGPEAHITPPSTRITRSRAAKSLPLADFPEPPEQDPLKVECGVKEESNGTTVMESDAPVLDFSDEKMSIARKKTSSVSREVSKEKSPKEKALKNEISKGGRVPLAGSNGRRGCLATDEESQFLGEKLSDEVARKRWPGRYSTKKSSNSITSSKQLSSDSDHLFAKHHYERAKVDGHIYNINDDVYVQGETGKPNYIGRIVEFFESTEGLFYFTSQWFFKAEDTVIGDIGKKSHAPKHHPKRLFLSEETDENLIDCIVSKLKIVKRDTGTKDPIPKCDFFYDMSYSVQYSSFVNLPKDERHSDSEESSTLSFDCNVDISKESNSSQANTVTVLDLYAGCGAMSTGLCHGAHLAGLHMETRWAIDINGDACRCLQDNHPNTKVLNEDAETFLALIKEWKILCEKYGSSEVSYDEHSNVDTDSEEEDSTSVFVVEKLLDICYGDPDKMGQVGLKFKVRWKGYGPDHDSWEPIDGLSNCQDCLCNFVKSGMQSKLLPLHGNVDVICGGPPCQGISGFNRFRDFASPLNDVKNKQMLVYMEIVDVLKPKYVLMENVVDIVKFSGGFLGRYALSFLVSRNYQARLGIMAAGCYGLPQFRLRVFLWGARYDQKLPQFPLPTHNVVLRGHVPNEFDQNLVGYNEDELRNLKNALLLVDAISDLPSVSNSETRDAMPYLHPPKTEFQRFIRTPESELMNVTAKQEGPSLLFDHRPLELNEDDLQRVKQIPKKKGANFRDLPGLRVGPGKVIERDPDMDIILLPSKKPLVPNYAITFVKGKSLKPFGRLWWDETVPTVVTRAEPHNQKILHPNQDRVLTVRESARLQGFPDYYRLSGPIKQRYMQVGNAVAFPVSRALGYSLGKAYQKVPSENEFQFILPENFPLINNNQ